MKLASLLEHYYVRIELTELKDFDSELLKHIISSGAEVYFAGNHVADIYDSLEWVPSVKRLMKQTNPSISMVEVRTRQLSKMIYRPARKELYFLVIGRIEYKLQNGVADYAVLHSPIKVTSKLNYSCGVMGNLPIFPDEVVDITKAVTQV